MLAANIEKRIFQPDGLRYACGFVWFRHCLNSTALGKVVGPIYRDASFARDYQPALQEKALFHLRVTMSGTAPQ
jgi:hypothetical protein